MMLLAYTLLLLLGTVSLSLAEQKALAISSSSQDGAEVRKHIDKPKLRKLQGRFLHITDLHPDAFYKPHSSIDDACHHGHGTAGVLGTEVSSCDTPISFINATFQWIQDHLKDQIDFVIWTGDSARHDNDEHIPRTETQIVELNKLMVEKFVQVFGKDDNLDDPDPTNDFVVPIVPTFGNNDMMPHNIFEPGPNRWTRDYAEIWKKFIPEAQKHSFARGGWFFTEVIPNKLAVFSLNTIYFFNSNSAVDGCDAKSEPGYEHMDWLRVQLELLRERGMKAIIIGHVPPARMESKRNWDETCWQKYSLWMRQYRDIIVTGFFGHMNTDHFLFQDSFKLKYKVRSDGAALEADEWNSSDPIFSTTSKTDYLMDLRHSWTKLPTPPKGMSYFPTDFGKEIMATRKDKKHKLSKHKKRKKFLREIGGEWAERYSLSLISPSVVPKYFPTLRVVEYNITGLENEHPASVQFRPPMRDFDPGSAKDNFPTMTFDGVLDVQDSPLYDQKKKKKKKKKKKHKKPKQSHFVKPRPPPAAAPPGPAYSPQPFALTSYTQYFANLTFLNHDFERSGLSLEEYIGTKGDGSDIENEQEPSEKSTTEAKPRFEYHVEYNTRTDKMYKMQDLTVRSCLDLAYRIVSNLEKQPAKFEDQALDDLPGGTSVHAVHPTDDDQFDIGVDDEAPGSDEPEMEKNKDVNDQKKKHKKGKKHKKKKKTHKHTKYEELWHAFVKRAFVMTKDDQDMDDFE